jgi:serine/threonine protein kinase
MSPEIWSNKPYNESSDMWALGCLIYELCGLAPPFLGDSFPQLKRAVLQGRYKAIPRCYSYEMSTVISKLLRVNPGTRPSAADLLRSPEVQKYMKPGGYGAIAPESHRPIDLMATIVVPAGPKRRISSVLPAPGYPHAPPHTPTQRPRYARDPKEALDKKERKDQGGGMAPISENGAPTAGPPVPASPLPIRANNGAAKVVSSARQEASRHTKQPERSEPTRKALAPLNNRENGNRPETDRHQKPPRQPVANSRQAGARPNAGAQYAVADKAGLMKPSRPGRENAGGRPNGGRPSGRPAGGAKAVYGNHGAAQVGSRQNAGYAGGGAPNYRRGQYSYKPSWWG